MDSEAIAPILILGFLIYAVCWIYDVRRAAQQRSEQLSMIAQFHSRMLEKIGSAEEFSRFLSSEGGKTFLETLEAEPPAPPPRRSLGALQAGIVLACAGAALLFIAPEFPKDPSVRVMGVLGVATGFGFGLSTLANLLLRDKI